MSEFTKDELRCFHGLCDEHYGDDEITRKLQSLIDNYCEHKNTTLLTDNGMATLCIKCDELTGWA